MPSPTDFYAVIGEIATQFSNVEFLVAEIAAKLVGMGNPVVPAIVIGHRSLEQKTKLIKQLAVFRYLRNQGMDQAAKELVGELNRYRQQRNLFIHGMWQVQRSAAAGEVSCLDMGWKIKTDNRRWRRGSEEKWTIEKLRGLSREVGELFNRLLDFQKRMATEKMADIDLGEVAHELVGPSPPQ